MADVKVILTGNEFAELRNLLMRDARKLDNSQLQASLEVCGYHNFDHISLDEQVKFIAEQLLFKFK